MITPTIFPCQFRRAWGASRFQYGLDCLPGARRIEERETVKATESDEVKGFRFLEPFQTVLHGPSIARYDPLIAIEPR
jgi:hypothetical protein